MNSPGYGGSYLLPNVDWIEELQVKGLGAGAEYGNFQVDLVNIVTSSGSNTFQSGNLTAHYTITQNGSRGLRGYGGSSAIDQVRTQAIDSGTSTLSTSARFVWLPTSV